MRATFPLWQLCVEFVGVSTIWWTSNVFGSGNFDNIRWSEISDETRLNWGLCPLYILSIKFKVSRPDHTEREREFASRLILHLVILLLWPHQEREFVDAHAIAARFGKCKTKLERGRDFGVARPLARFHIYTWSCSSGAIFSTRHHWYHQGRKKRGGGVTSCLTEVVNFHVQIVTFLSLLSNGIFHQVAPFACWNQCNWFWLTTWRMKLQTSWPFPENKNTWLFFFRSCQMGGDACKGTMSCRAQLETGKICWLQITASQSAVSVKRPSPCRYKIPSSVFCFRPREA